MELGGGLSFSWFRVQSFRLLTMFSLRSQDRCSAGVSGLVV